MSSLQIQVFMNESALATGKRIFERVITVDDSIAIDYTQIIKVLRFMFGAQVIINFNIKLL